MKTFANLQHTAALSRRFLPALLALLLLAGCAQPPAAPAAGDEAGLPEEDIFIDRMVLEEIELENEAVALAEGPAATDTLLLPVASGTATKKSARAVVDYSNITDGYVMVQFSAATAKRLKVQVKGPSTTYTYDLPAQAWTTFPLSDGNGGYQVTVLENTSGKKYAVELSVSFTVTLKDEFAPFLRPNQYVNYEGAVETVKQAAALTKDIEAPLEKVGAVYNYVVKTLSYDKARAEAVINRQLVGYLPVLDSVLAEKKGICFDYAALMTGMLRSQGVPCKLVVGYAGTTYHAWVSVWTRETGWVDNAIYFDGTTWHRMDPTFASSGNSSEAIMQFIGDGKNYTVKYLY